MCFDLSSQIEGHAPSIEVIGPDNGLFLKFSSHYAAVYVQGDFPCPTGRDDPVIVGRKAASGVGDLLDMKGCCAFIE
jgi:hypothetical protein